MPPLYKASQQSSVRISSARNTGRCVNIRPPQTRILLSLSCVAAQITLTPRHETQEGSGGYLPEFLLGFLLKTPLAGIDAGPSAAPPRAGCPRPAHPPTSEALQVRGRRALARSCTLPLPAVVLQRYPPTPSCLPGANLPPRGDPANATLPLREASPTPVSAPTFATI